MATIPRTPEEHRRWWEENADSPYGRCWCGCGERTVLASCSNAGKLQVRGCPRQYIHNHHKRQFCEEYLVIDLGYETPCWISQRGASGDGYAAITIDGKQVRVHRLFYEQVHGPVAADLELDHLCVSRTRGAGGSTLCINPDHLEPVTSTENQRRRATTKLTMAKAQHIRHLYQQGVCTQRELAKQFGVSRGTIRNVLDNKTWRAA